MLSRRLRAHSLAALAALGLGALAPRAARAAEDLQAFVATMSPTGTTIDLTAAGSLDWAHWGYGMTGGPFGQSTTPTTNRKIMTGAGLIGALQVLPPPSGASTYWSPARSTTVQFRWNDGMPVRDPGVGVSVTEGVGSAAESTFTLRAQSGPDLRQLSIYVAFDCTGFDQVDVTMGSKTARITSADICVGKGLDENHRISIRYSSDSRVDVVVTIKGAVLGEVGPTVYAATLAGVTSSGDPGSANGGAAGGNAGTGVGGGGVGGTGATGSGGGTAGAAGGGSGVIGGGGSGGQAGGGGTGAAGNAGGGAGGTFAGTGGQASGQSPKGRVLACDVPAVAPGSSPAALAPGLALLWLASTRRRRRRPPESEGA